MGMNRGMPPTVFVQSFVFYSIVSGLTIRQASGVVWIKGNRTFFLHVHSIGDCSGNGSSLQQGWFAAFSAWGSCIEFMRATKGPVTSLESITDAGHRRAEAPRGPRSHSAVAERYSTHCRRGLCIPGRFEDHRLLGGVGSSIAIRGRDTERGTAGELSLRAGTTQLSGSTRTARGGRNASIKSASLHGRWPRPGPPATLRSRLPRRPLSESADARLRKESPLWNAS